MRNLLRGREVGDVSQPGSENPPLYIRGSEGMVVRIRTANSGVLTGMLAVDPAVPNRAVIWFP